MHQSVRITRYTHARPPCYITLHDVILCGTVYIRMYTRRILIPENVAAALGTNGHTAFHWSELVLLLGP
jgi:hypothetical protein